MEDSVAIHKRSMHGASKGSVCMVRESCVDVSVHCCCEHEEEQEREKAETHRGPTLVITTHDDHDICCPNCAREPPKPHSA